MNKCPYCKSNNVILYMGGTFNKYECKDCGYIGPFIIEVKINPVKVLIIGGGFAGLQTALSLKKIMKNKIAITLIDKNRHSLFVPEIIKYLVNKLKKEDITVDLSKTLNKRKIRFLREEINRIDPKKKIVHLKNKEISYDYLVISIGSETNNYNIKGVDKYTYKYKTLKDVELIKRKITELLALNKKINISVIGGGITGVEVASQLRSYFDNKIKNKEIDVSLIESSSRLVKELPKTIGKNVEKLFLNKKINIFFNSKVVKLEKNKIYLSSSQTIHSDLTIWVAGVCASKELRNLNLDFCNNGIYVNKYLQTTNNSFVFASGDCISFKDDHLNKYPLKRAYNALKQGRLVAKNIANLIVKRKMIPYADKEVPTILLLDNKSILNYKNFTVQSIFIAVLEKFIRLRHMFYLN